MAQQMSTQDNLIPGMPPEEKKKMAMDMIRNLLSRVENDEYDLRGMEMNRSYTRTEEGERTFFHPGEIKLTMIFDVVDKGK